jgi:hypothetical protein
MGRPAEGGPGARTRCRTELAGGGWRGPRIQGRTGEGEAQERGADAKVDHRPQGPGGFSSSSPPGVPVLLQGARLFLFSKQAPPRSSLRTFGTSHSRGRGDLSRLVVMRHSDDDFSPSVTCFKIPDSFSRLS